MARLAAHRVAGLYLAQRVRFGMKFGLETMRALVAELGHPERAAPALLVAGTNGKGSVAAYCDAALRASGLRSGRYTSPHLVRVNERITVDGREISDSDFARAVRAVRDAAARLVKRRVLRAHPTFFEVLTAAAFEHFRHARVDVAVLEVGLGGRLDATNVADPVASAIVSIALDHEVYLGRTLAAIAREKAGVLREGRATVLGPLAPEARAAIEREARRLGASLVDAAEGARVGAAAIAGRARQAGEGGPGDRLVIETDAARYPDLRPLPGAHQRDNLLVALRLLEEARRAGVPVDLARVPTGVAATRWPGRLQRIPAPRGRPDQPALLLDGAHNPEGARALAAHLAQGPPFVLLFGAMADKDVRGIARALFPPARAVVLTKPRRVSRAASPEALARRAGRLARGARRERSVARALRLARRLAHAEGASCEVVVAGSLYLVGAVLSLVERESRRRRGGRLRAGARSRGSRSPAPPAARRSRGRSRAPRAR